MTTLAEDLDRLALQRASDNGEPTRPFMRAKMQVARVVRSPGQDTVTLNCVAKSGAYPADGHDEDNSFAKFSPSGTLELTIANPALVGKIEPGRKFYLDFTEAD